MEKAAATKLKARKKPSQSRSQEKVAIILNATCELLTESGGLASANLTTHRIAKKAGIAVGSLYQYFPNVEAVLYEIYRGFAERAREVLSEFDSAVHLALPRSQFFENLFRAITANSPEDSDIIRAIRTEAKAYSALATVEQAQAEYFAREMAKFLKYYGSTWQEDRLEQLGLFVYYLDCGTWMYRGHVQESTDDAQEWELCVFNTMIERSFD